MERKELLMNSSSWCSTVRTSTATLTTNECFSVCFAGITSDCEDRGSWPPMSLSRLFIGAAQPNGLFWKWQFGSRRLWEESSGTNKRTGWMSECRICTIYLFIDFHHKINLRLRSWFTVRCSWKCKCELDGIGKSSWPITIAGALAKLLESSRQPLPSSSTIKSAEDWPLNSGHVKENSVKFCNVLSANPSEWLCSFFCLHSFFVLCSLFSLDAKRLAAADWNDSSRPIIFSPRRQVPPLRPPYSIVHVLMF